MFRMREQLRAALLVAAMVACAALPASALGASPAGASAAAHLAVGGSVEQVYVTGARSGERVALVNRRGATVAVRPAGALGGLIFRGVKPGPGYSVRPAADAGGPLSRAVTVLPDRSAPPSTKIYDQQHPDVGVWLPDHARRHEARDRRAPARPDPARTRRWSSTPATATPTLPGRTAGSRRSRTCSASRSSTSTCAAPAARAGRSTTSSRCRASTATT